MVALASVNSIASQATTWRASQDSHVEVGSCIFGPGRRSSQVLFHLFLGSAGRPTSELMCCRGGLVLAGLLQFLLRLQRHEILPLTDSVPRSLHLLVESFHLKQQLVRLHLVSWARTRKSLARQPFISQPFLWRCSRARSRQSPDMCVSLNHPKRPGASTLRQPSPGSCCSARSKPPPGIICVRHAQLRRKFNTQRQPWRASPPYAHRAFGAAFGPRPCSEMQPISRPTRLITLRALSCKEFSKRAMSASLAWRRKSSVLALSCPLSLRIWDCQLSLTASAAFVCDMALSCPLSSACASGTVSSLSLPRPLSSAPNTQRFDHKKNRTGVHGSGQKPPGPPRLRPPWPGPPERAQLNRRERR